MLCICGASWGGGAIKPVEGFSESCGVGLASHVVELGAVLGEAKPGKALSFVDNQILWWALVSHFVEPSRVALGGVAIEPEKGTGCGWVGQY